MACTILLLKGPCPLSLPEILVSVKGIPISAAVEVARLMSDAVSLAMVKGPMNMSSHQAAPCRPDRFFQSS